MTAIKKIFIVPLILLMGTVAIIFYNLSLISDHRKLKIDMKNIEERIEANREMISKIEMMEGKRDEFLKYSRLSMWIPMFRNPLEAELFLAKKIEGLLKETNGSNVGLTWKVIQGSSKVKDGRLGIIAKFPSYDRFLSFIRRLEEDPPLFIPHNLDLRKDGSGIEVSMNILFQFRIKDEAI
jgi:hypothetical protein